MGTERGIELTLREWEQAWAHYRHLETARAQYLGFFFTAVLGITAFAGPRLADGSLRTTSATVTVAVLAVGLEFLAGVVYLAVTRLNEVLVFYGELIGALRDWMRENGAAFDLTPFETAPDAPRLWSDSDGIARAVVGAGLVGFPLVSLGVVIWSNELSGISSTTAICALAFVTSVGIAIWVVIGRSRPADDTAADA